MQSTNKALTSTDWKALLDTEANEQGCSVAQPTPPQGWASLLTGRSVHA